MFIEFEGPDGPERHELPLGPNGLPRLHLAEVRHIQRVTDMRVTDLLERMSVFDADAWTVLVQVLWKRQGRVVRFDEVDLDLSTLSVAGDDVEVVESASAEGEAADGSDPTPESSGTPPVAG